MKTKRLVIAIVTAPNLKTARSLARVALEARAAACVNLVRGVESHYWWKGKIDHGSEVLMLLKTDRARLAALERLMVSHHPYDTPEFIVVKPSGGNERYLRWWHESLGPARRG
jgi:periplasmic divalent cation tolerance protein